MITIEKKPVGPAGGCEPIVEECRSIVLIDSQPETMRHVCAGLEAYGCEILACTPDLYLPSLRAHAFAVVLGPNLPVFRVNLLCEQIRRHTDAPILVFLQEPTDDYCSMVLDAGADHCLVGPGPGAARLIFSSIGALRRREERMWDMRGTVIEAGSLRIDIDRAEVTLHGSPVPLTATEFRILTLLAQRAGQLLSPVEILKRIHGHEYDPDEARDIVKVHVSRLRQKLDADPMAARCILNVRGQGYRYVFDRRGELEASRPRIAV